MGSSLGKARQADRSAAEKARVEVPSVGSAAAPAVQVASGRTVRVDPAVARTPAAVASTRTTRVTRVYTVHHYGGWSPHPYADDPYHPMLTGFLLGQLTAAATRPQATLWAYHHWDSLDQARRDELVRENSGLRAELASLQARGVPRDPGYELPGLDPDLAYSDEVAQATYAPAGPSAWRVLGWLLAGSIFLALAACVVHFFFFHESATFARLAR